MSPTIVLAGDNDDIARERRSATFDIERLAAFIHGGVGRLRRRREILAFVASTREFDDARPIEQMDRIERIENNVRKAVAMSAKFDFIDQSDFFGEGLLYQSLIMGRDFHGMSLHYAMFIPTLQGQADDEQLDTWLPLAVSCGIIGTYAQTELGHGTNIKKLETTATYDRNSQEFVLDTPTVSAIKWWPGGLAKTCNYAIVPAQLIINGVSKGIHMFIVQIRDLETHQTRKGVVLGDMGPKFGVNGNDNGFLMFKKYRILRRNMLMGHAKVTSNGDYIASEHPKLRYGTMVFVRSIMIRDQAMQLAAAVTIAARYSVVRRQGEYKQIDQEAQILDYQSQQYRILPQIARALVFLFAADEIKHFYQTVSTQLSEGKMELFEEMHVLSAGLKAVVSWEVALGIEQCRLACGGHGYSHASGLPSIYTYAVAGCTYEGENIVMLLQVARFLMKLVEQRTQSQHKHSSHIVGYLNNNGQLRSSLLSSSLSSSAAAKTVLSSFQWLNFSSDTLIADFEQAARNQIFECYKRIQNLKKTGIVPVEAWNLTSVELCRASRLHVKCYLAKAYFARIKTLEYGNDNERRVLELLGQLYTLNEISSHSASFRKADYMSDEQIATATEGVYAIMQTLRPETVAVVDAFDLSDRELQSALGQRDGNVYQAMLAWANRSELNKTDVFEAFHKHLGPMMSDGRSKL